MRGDSQLEGSVASNDLPGWICFRLADRDILRNIRTGPPLRLAGKRDTVISERYRKSYALKGGASFRGRPRSESDRGRRDTVISERYRKSYPQKEGVAFSAGPTRLELATSCVTGRRSNQAELRPQNLTDLIKPLHRNPSPLYGRDFVEWIPDNTSKRSPSSSMPDTCRFCRHKYKQNPC